MICLSVEAPPWFALLFFVLGRLACGWTQFRLIQKKLKLKWRYALRNATQSKQRWTRKAAEWNPGLDKSTNAQRRARILAKRWEDDLNDFVKAEATETAQSNDLKNDTTWFQAATNAD